MKRQSSKESSSNLFNRYVWLVDTIYRAGKITYEDLNDRWTRSGLNEMGDDIPLRTFHNHRKAIEEMFDINIECDKRNGYVYYIENSEDMERGGVRSWLLNTFAINNLINESHKLKHRILFEHIPSGQQFLTSILEAMQKEMVLEVSYQSFWNDYPSTFAVEPFCVKVFKQRWYLIGRSDKVRIYALDRVQSIQHTGKRFSLPKDFDAESYFAHCFGIIHSEKAETVELKVFSEANKDRYFQSLPLHPSQEIVEETDDYTLFRYYIQPTYDFRQEILSHGSDVEVLSPAWFREEIANIIAAQTHLYK